MNKGISLCSGEYIGLLNSDDFYALSFFSNAVVKLNELNNKEVILYGDVQYPPPAQRKAPTNIYEFTEGIKLVYLVSHNSFLVHFNIYNRIGLYSTKLKIASDDQWVRTALQYKTLFYYLVTP